MLKRVKVHRTFWKENFYHSPTGHVYYFGGSADTFLKYCRQRPLKDFILADSSKGIVDIMPWQEDQSCRLYSSVTQGTEKEQEAGQGYEPLQAHPSDALHQKGCHSPSSIVTRWPSIQTHEPMEGIFTLNHHRCFPTDLKNSDQMTSCSSSYCGGKTEGGSQWPAVSCYIIKWTTLWCLLAVK